MRKTDQGLLRYSTFNIFYIVFYWRLSSWKIFWSSERQFKVEEYPTSGCWDIQHLMFWGCLSSFKFEENPISGCWYIQLSIFLGLPPLVVVFVLSILFLVWFPKLKFKVLRKSFQRLVIYSTFNILMSSSIGCCPCFEYFWFWFGPLSLSFKFDENPICGCWDIQLLLLWGLLPLLVVFH